MLKDEVKGLPFTELVHVSDEMNGHDSKELTEDEMITKLWQYLAVLRDARIYVRAAGGLVKCRQHLGYSTTAVLPNAMNSWWKCIAGRARTTYTSL